MSMEHVSTVPRATGSSTGEVPDDRRQLFHGWHGHNPHDHHPHNPHHHHTHVHLPPPPPLPPPPSPPIVCDCADVTEQDLFTVEVVGTNQLACKGGISGLYCSDDAATNGRLVCDRTAVGAWERFTVEWQGGDTYALKSGRTGLYCNEGRVLGLRRSPP